MTSASDLAGRHLPRWAWLCVFAAMLAAFLRLAVFHGFAPRGTDDQYYFAQARSLVVDGDLDLRNELGQLTPRPENVHLSTAQPWHESTATGKVSIKYAVGTAVLMAPFIAVAHAGACTVRALGGSLAANGYELPYYVAWGLGNLVWALVALAAARRLVAEKLGMAPFASLLVTVIAFGCSPLAYHTVGDPYMAHVPSAALVAVVLLLALVPNVFAARWRRFEPFVAGLAAGLAIATRPTDMLWAACLLLPLSRRELRWRSTAIPTIGAGLVLGVLPQLLAAKSVYGSYFHYTYGSEAFHFPPPYVVENLFGDRAGLFPWNPLWLPALAMALFGRGLPLLVRGAAIGLVAWNSAWWCHWWGDTYGGRAHASLFPVVACGLGRLAMRASPVVARRRRAGRLLLGSGILVLVLGAFAWTALLIWRMETMPQQERARGLAMPYRSGTPSAR